MDKTFAAIEKLKGVELELLRLKNALDMMNKAYEAKREWQGLTHEELTEIIGISSADSDWNVLKVINWAKAIEARLREKNSG